MLSTERRNISREKIIKNVKCKASTFTTSKTKLIKGKACINKVNSI